MTPDLIAYLLLADLIGRTLFSVGLGIGALAIGIWLWRRSRE